MSTVILDASGALPYGVGAVGSIVLIDPTTGEAYGVGIPGAVAGLTPLAADATLPQTVAAYNALLAALQGTV